MPLPSKGLAVSALALGLVGLFTGGLLGLGSVLGLLLAGLALWRASREPERFGGRDLAWAAVAANGCALATLVPLALLVVTSWPLLFPPDPGLPEPNAASRRYFDEGERASLPPPPPPPPPRPPSAMPPARPGPAPAGGPGGPSPSARAGPAPVRVGGEVREPRKVRHVDPVYPDIARQARVQGIVILECLITPEGDVGKVTVLRGIPLLDAAAIDAVRQWRYAPTLLEGRPVPVIMTVTVNFRLH